MGKQTTRIINLWLQNEEQASVFDAVLSYEAELRGISRGQVLVALVREAADVESYPPDVQKRLAAIEEQGRDTRLERATRAFIDAYATEKSA